MRFPGRALALAALLGVTPAAAEVEPGLRWMTNLGDALERASAESKPILVDVWAVWCVPCKQMDETTYKDATVVAEAGQFVLVKIDADVQIPVIDRYAVEAFPTILILDGKGGEIARYTGYRRATDLSARMRSVREGYTRYLESRDADDEWMGDYLVAAGNAEGATESYRKAVKGLEGDPERRDACEQRLAAAYVEAGKHKQATVVYDRLSRSAADPALRGQALLTLVKTQVAMGRRKDAQASLDRLSREFPDLVPGAVELGVEKAP